MITSINNRLIFQLSPQNISILYFSIGSLSSIYIFNFQFQALLLLQSLTFFLFCYKKSTVWMMASFWLVVINYLKYETNFLLLKDVVIENDHQIQEFLAIFAWFILKNVSYCLERIESLDERDEKFKLMSFLGYVFYLPTFITGPHVLYSRYCDMMDAKHEQLPLFKKMTNLILNVLRLTFWFFITELALHYLYAHTIVTSMNLKEINTLAFFGVGYLLGQFFNNKYVIHYGVPIALGEFDGISMPNKPKCICRIHKYSDMWKWFDHGLYEFLFKYIYIELCTKSSTITRKIFAGFVTFFFVYIWHGFFDYVLIWSVMNCTSIVMEKFVYNFIEGRNFRTKVVKILGTQNNYYRLHAFIGSHILIPAILSNFFFFGGSEVGWEFVRRTYSLGIVNYMKISLCIYFLYPIAEVIKRWEKNKVE